MNGLEVLFLSMPVNRKDFAQVCPVNRKEWREWLQKNHTQKESVWLLVAKAGHAGVTRMEAVEELLCFGWIDSVPNKLNDKYYKLLVSPRKPKSAWSKVNKTLVAKLIKSGLMQPSGMGMVKLAKKTGTWNALNAVDQLSYPTDFKNALSKNKTAQQYFDAFPPSTKKGILHWIQTARTAETRTKRIVETVTKAAKNIRANQYIKKI